MNDFGVLRDITDLRISQMSLIETNRLLTECQRFAHIGSYVYNLKVGLWDASPELHRIFGIDESFKKDLNGWLKIVSPDHRVEIGKYLNGIIMTNESFDNKYKIIRQSSGEELWVHGLGEFEYDEFGNPNRLIGTIQDITEKVLSEEKLQQSISLLTTTLEAIADGILVVNIDGEIFHSNNHFIEMWNIPKEVMNSGKSEERINFIKRKTKNPKLFLEVIKETALNPEMKSFDEIELIDGRSIERYSIPQYINGEVVGRVWSFRDVTSRKLSEIKLKESEEHFKNVVEFSQDAFYKMNLEDGKFDYVSPVFEKLIGYSQDELVKMDRTQILDRIHRDDFSQVQKQFLFTNFSEESSVSLEYRFLCKNGEYRWLADKFICVKDENENYIYGSMHDISERKQYEDEIIYSSYHDSLTGLYNRRYLDKEMSRLDKPENLPISIIVGDVNGLKLANDTFGHNVGDKILKKCAEIISDTCREADIIARWGGDEFIVFMVKTDFNEVSDIVRLINERCANVQINSVPVSISLGFETKQTMVEDVNEVFKIAEDFMYKHKMVETTSIRGKTIEFILNTLYEKNQREEEHSRRVSEICALIGIAMKLPENIVSKLRAIGLVHDIGKIALSEEILNKLGKLNDEEWAEMKRHSEIGYRILGSKAEMSEVADQVLMHHERLDGSGYPKGLKGDQIPLFSRILALADSYDSMTSNRTYKVAMTEKYAIEEIIDKAGTLFDPEISRVFVEKVMNSKWETIEK